MRAEARGRPSLRVVLTAVIAGTAALAVVLTAVLTFGLGRLGAERRAIAELETDAGRLARLAEGLPCRPGDVPPALRRQLGGRDALFVPDGSAVGALAELDERGRANIAGEDVLYGSREASVCGVEGRIYAFRSAAGLPSLPEGFGARLFIAVLASLAGAGVVGVVLARRLSRPLVELADAARWVGRGAQGDARLSVEPGDVGEVAELRRAFVEMSEDLRAVREREQAFLLSVSHELRTPLTSIRGYGEALADGTARDPGSAGEVVLRESRRLERLVGDLIDLARLEAGEFSVEVEEVDLSALAVSVGDALRYVADDAGVALAVDAPAPVRVETDPDRVQQMLTNLTENALRVTPRGGRVTVEVSPSSVSVVDSGPGLDPEDVEHAFDRFHLWRKYRGERAVGSGLGLAVVRELADLLGVDVRIDSERGRGTRFTLDFDA